MLMKYCEKCGNKMDDDSIFCSKCGRKFVLIEDEDNVVVGVSTTTQCLVDTEHVGLVAVVDIAVAALNQDGILVGALGVDEVLIAASADLLHKVVAGALLVVEEEPGSAGVGGAATRATEVAAVEYLAVHNLPLHIGGCRGGSVGVAVEAYLARGTDEVHQLSLLHSREIHLHRCGAPCRTGCFGRAGNGNDGLIDIAAYGLLVLCVAGSEGGKHQGVVELTLGKGGQHAETRLVAHFETGGGVGVWREALVAL